MYNQLLERLCKNVYFRNEVRPRLSELRSTGIPAIRHKTARNGFLPLHFTPLIRKPRCPTRKFRNGYVKSIEKKTLNRITPTVPQLFIKS